MTCFSRLFLLVGTAVLALSACSSDKGPGALGTKNDIIVRNNGMPGQKQSPLPPSSAGDFSSTVEQGQAMPAPEVAKAEPVAAPESVKPAAPEVEAVAQKIEESKAPVPSTTATPMADNTPSAPAPTTQTTSADVVAPEPVVGTEPSTPPAAPKISRAEPEVTPQARPSSPAIETKPEAAPVAPMSAPMASAPPAGTPIVPPTAAAVPSAAPKMEPKPVEVSRAVPEAAPTAAPVLAPVTTSEPAPQPEAATAKPEAMTQFASAPRSSVYPDADFAAQKAEPVKMTSLYDPKMIQGAQEILTQKGYYKGSINGGLNSEFLNALSRYQGDNNLPTGGMNIQTAQSLGLDR